MGHPDRHTPQGPTLPCEMCMKEIPESVAQSYEGPDYVLYFCGNDCFDKWEHQQARKGDRPKKKAPSTKPKSP